MENNTIAHTSFLLSTILVLSVIIISAFISKKLKISTVIGYIITGAIIGPNAFGLIKNTNTIHSLGEIGILFLLFTIGMELPYDRLKTLRKYIFGLGPLQVLSTIFIITIFFIIIGISIYESMIFASALCLSSTAVVMQILTDKQKITARFGRVSFCILLFQDLAVVLFLVFMTNFKEQDTDIVKSIALSITKGTIVIVIISIISRFFLKKIFHIISKLKSVDLFMGTTVIVIIGTGILTQAGGLSAELGAFLAGLAMANTEYKHHVEADIMPFRGILLALFFITVGTVHIDFHILNNNLIVILLGVIGITVIKAFCLWFSGWSFALDKKINAKVSLLLSSCGEFSLVILSVATSQNMVTEKYSKIIFMITVISMSCTPILYSIGNYISRIIKTDDMQDNKKEETKDLSDHIIIIGCGKIGLGIYDILKYKNPNIVSIDNDMNQVIKARSKGYLVFFGDGIRMEMLKLIGITRAKVAVISISRQAIAFKVASIIKKNFPNIKVVVKIADEERIKKLEEQKIDVIHIDHFENSIKICDRIFNIMGYNNDEISSINNQLKLERQSWK